MCSSRDVVATKLIAQPALIPYCTIQFDIQSLYRLRLSRILAVQVCFSYKLPLRSPVPLQPRVNY